MSLYAQDMSPAAATTTKSVTPPPLPPFSPSSTAPPSTTTQTDATQPYFNPRSPCMEVLILSGMQLQTNNGAGLQEQIKQTIHAVLRRAIQEKQFQVHFTVACPSPIIFPTAVDPLFQHPGVTLLHVIPQPLLRYHPENDFFRGYIEPVQIVGRVMRHYNELGIKPHVIHSYDWSTAYAAHTLALNFQVPWLYSISLSMKRCKEMLLQENPGMFLGDFTSNAEELEEYGLLHCNHIVHVSAAQRQYFSSTYLHKTNVVHNGLSAPQAVLEATVKPWFRSGNSTENYPLPGTNPIKVLYLGRLSQQKNVHTLLECKLPDNVDLLIAGPESQDERIVTLLREKIHDSSASRVYYLGPVYGLDKWKLLAAVQFVMMPSIHEPFGLVALEAMACNTVVLSSFAEGLAEVLTDEFAIRCGTRKETIEAALLDASQMSMDEYNRRIQAGFRRAISFDWQNVGRQILDLYQYLLTYNLSYHNAAIPAGYGMTKNAFV